MYLFKYRALLITMLSVRTDRLSCLNIIIIIIIIIIITCRRYYKILLWLLNSWELICRCGSEAKSKPTVEA